MMNMFTLSPAMMADRKLMEEEAHTAEIRDLFKNYAQISGAEPASERNAFVATFYNRYPASMNKEQIQFLKDHITKYVQIKETV